MKKAIVTMGLLLPLILFAQEKFVIKGRLGNLDAPAKIYLFYQQLPDFTEVADSAVLRNGAFEFKGTTKYPVEASLHLRRKGEGYYNGADECCFLYIENGVITVTGDSLHQATVKGGMENNNYQQLQTLLKPTRDGKLAFYRQQAAIPRDQLVTRDDVRKKTVQFLAAEKAAYKQFVRTHTSSFVSFRLLRYEFGKVPSVDEVGPLYHLLSDRIKKSEPGKLYGDRIAGWERAKTGMQAPDFTLTDTLNKPVSLSDLKGTYVLLNFWATYCGPCIQEKPHLKKTYTAFKDKNFNLLDVSMPDKSGKYGDRNKWVKMLRRFALPWINVYGDAATDLYGIEAVPQNFLIDPAGRIIAHDVHGEALDKKLKELLGKK
jgi:thiol-disulfide isomerase/thioredoxin